MRTFICAIIAFFALEVSAQQANDPVLLKIDDKEITKAEFEAIYKKNNRDSAITQADLDEYLELFINFKLKVLEAEKLGRDTLDQFQRELAGYRDQLARPYLVDKSITDSLVQEAYARMRTEVKASHILIKLPPDPSPEDTLKAHKTVMDILSKVKKNPSSFAQVAQQQSEDPSARTNSGDLGYFTSLQMVYPFETLVYNTPAGEIGGPVRTQFGYHIVKVEGSRDARGQIRVAHIMVRADQNDPPEVAESLKKRIDEVYTKLQAGESFADLATKFSDDRSSAAKGGELPAFGAGKMVGEFEEAAFSLENQGDYSEPILSPYGWHIVKLLEKMPVTTYEEMEKDLRSKISRDSRSEITRDTFLAKRKAEYNFSENPKMLQAFYKAVDTTYMTGDWKPDEKLRNSDKELFTLDGIKHSQGDFAEYLYSSMRPTPKRPSVNSVVNDKYRQYVQNTIMMYEDSRLEDKHPEFKALINEYRDGILLFDLTDEKVWSKAVKDSAGLADFYQSHKADFMWKERAGFDIYTVEDEATGKSVIKMLKKKKNQDEIRTALNKESDLKVRVESGMKEKSEVPVLEKTAWEKGASEIINDDGQLKVIHIKEIRKPQPKDFNEARGLITAAYQNHLEKRWIAELRKEHEIQVNKEILYTIQ